MIKNIILKGIMFSIAMILSVVPAMANSAELAVIVNASNPVDKLKAVDAKAYYLKSRAAWSNGEQIRPIDLKGDSDTRQAFIENVLNMTGEDVARYWLEQQYASAKKPPTRASDDSSVIKLVSRFKGGIGFVNKASLASAGSADVKTILVVKY